MPRVPAQASVRLLGIVENDAERVAVTPPQSAHAVANVYAIEAARALSRAMMHGEDGPFALHERNDFRPRLHARPLLREHEFTPGEIVARTRQQEGDLQWKDVLAINVLVQAIVVAGLIGEEKRRRLRLAGLMTACEIGGVILRKLRTRPHGIVPAVGDFGQRRGLGRPPSRRAPPAAGGGGFFFFP